MATHDQLETWEQLCLESQILFALEEVGDIAWELEGDAIDVDVVSDLLQDAWEARRDSDVGN